MTFGKEFSAIVKKCKVLLLDIEGTTTSISFVKDKLFPYAEENVKKYLDDKWDSEGLKEVIQALRKLSLEDKENNVEGVVEIPGEDASKEDQIEGVVKSVKWMMSSDRKAGPLKKLQGLIWKQGYDQGDIKGHVYDDVSPALEQWHSAEGQKIFIYSSGSVQAQKLLFGQSLAGDLLKLIDGHFDTAVGAKQEKESYVKITEQIGCKPEEILFLTDIEKEAQAAREAGLHVALVQRDGNSPLTEEATSTYPVITSFNQLAVNNKRKQDDQDEQPTKIPRTETQEEVKSKIQDAPMDVAKDEKESEKETPAIVEETIVEEITDSNEAEDVPEVNIEPVVVEEKPSTEEKETVQDKEAKKESTESIKEKSQAEDIIESIEVTEVEDEPEKLNDVDEIMDGIEPVVEEPENIESEMAELHNVGEELEKECDAILSKVESVTNLDNIIAKPMLDTVSEENIDDANLDTSDIVENVLDSEQDVEMRKNAHDKEIKELEQKSETNAVDDKVSTETDKDAPKKSESQTNEQTINKSSNDTIASLVETKVNGNSTAVVNLNGDSNDSNSRLADNADRLSKNGAKGDTDGTNADTNGANGDTNGANGDTISVEVGQGDNKVETVTEIKVKTVTAEEVQAEPAEQTAET